MLFLLPGGEGQDEGERSSDPTHFLSLIFQDLEPDPDGIEALEIVNRKS